MKNLILFSTGKSESIEPKASLLGRYGGAALILFIFLASSFSGRAQTSAVQIIDLAPVYMPVRDSVSSTIDTSQVNLRVGFKVSDMSQAGKAHILLGTAIDSGDVITLTADFILQSGAYYLVLNGDSFPVHGYEAHIEKLFNKTQISSAQYITLFVEDKTGLMTLHLNRRMH